MYAPGMELEDRVSPGELSLGLRRVAAAIERSGSPSRSAVASAVLRLLVATDRSLAESIRDALAEKIRQVVPGEFDGGLYDTNPGGKGFRKGYISFGLDPTTWETKGIVGGILIQCTFDSSLFRSEAPEPSDPAHAEWLKGPGHSTKGAILELYVTGCYYNKLLGGGCAEEHGGGSGSGSGENLSGGAVSGPADLGDVNVMVDAQEKVLEVTVDAPTMSAELKKIIADIAAAPPAVAQGAGWKKKNLAPTGSPQALQKWLLVNKRTDVGRSELEALSRAMANRGVGPYGMLLEKNTDYFRKGGWAINPKA